jgi:hypothetical protein
MGVPRSGNSFILSYKKTGSWTGIVTENEPVASSSGQWPNSELIAQAEEKSSR